VSAFAGATLRDLHNPVGGRAAEVRRPLAGGAGRHCRIVCWRIVGGRRGGGLAWAASTRRTAG